MLAPLLVALATAVAPARIPLPTQSFPVPADAVRTALPASAQVELGVGLRLSDRPALERLLAAQAEPGSPLFRHWLTPQVFGERFGASMEVVKALSEAFRAGGLEVSPSPNRIFLNVKGRASRVQELLGVHLWRVESAQGTWLTFTGTPTLGTPAAKQVLHLSGLDTFNPHRIRLATGRGDTFGPQDLRRFYGLEALHQRGYTGRGAHVVVLGTLPTAAQAPDPADIAWFYRNVAGSAAQLELDPLSTSSIDRDNQQGLRQELEMDAELSSVGAPGEALVTLVESPASQLLTAGVDGVVNRHPDAVSVSISFGLCEPYGSASARQVTDQLLMQGAAEGQSWFAASGDDGADDCRDGSQASVDFPASAPYMTAVGGTQSVQGFDALHGIPGYGGEVAWNLGLNGGAGGGGASATFPKPSWQVGLGQGTRRELPDFSLLSSPYPGVATVTSRPGQISAVGGTSDAAPLAAGIFALVNDALGGCRLGTVNPLLWSLGANQQAGGVAVFHDVTSGNLSFNGIDGPSAGPGYDQATGWGSLDVGNLVGVLPPCFATALADGGPGWSVDADGGPRVPYDACAVLDCPTGTSCYAQPEGPSACVVACPLEGGDASCPHGEICQPLAGFGSACATGCRSDTDCDAPQVCSPCRQQCVNAGNTTAHVGDACQRRSDCPTGATCYPSQYGFPDGYCTVGCDSGDADAICGCGAGAACLGDSTGGMCFAICDAVSGSGCRQGYVCQPVGRGTSACLPPCTVGGTDCGDLRCDPESGLCVDGDGGASGPVDAGTPLVDAGAQVTDAGPASGAQGSVTPTRSTEGWPSCASAGPGSFGWALLALLGLGWRRRGR